MQVTKALPAARYVIGLEQVGARRRALITDDRKSVELVLLVLDALRDVVILGYCFGPRVLGLCFDPHVFRLRRPALHVP